MHKHMFLGETGSTEEVACSGERVPGDLPVSRGQTERRWPIEEESASQPSGLDGSRKVVTFQMVCIPRVTCEVKVSLHHQAVTPTTIVVWKSYFFHGVITSAYRAHRPRHHALCRRRGRI